jgi:cyclic pyranopterin monophosphate synthase
MAASDARESKRADGLTHLDAEGNVHMVNVGAKDQTVRTAIAAGEVRMSTDVVDLLRKGDIEKGNVLAIAKTAGIMAAKRTAELIPLCHPLLLDHVEIDFVLREDRIEIGASVSMTGRTGAEMEALTAVSVSALTIYDMCKAIDKSMVLGEIRLMRKTGGKSGHFKRDELTD